MSRSHPLGDLVEGALRGRFPPADGGWHRVAPWRPGIEAVVAFTGHAVLAVDASVDDARLVALGVAHLVDGYGGAHHPRLVAALAGSEGWIDVLDAVLVADGTGGVSGDLVPRPDLGEHPRVRYARELRDDVQVLGAPGPNDDSLVTLGRGFAGLTEMSVEVDPRHRGRGQGSRLIAAARSQVPQGNPLVALVSPGNAASLRAFGAAGFTVVGSAQLYRPERAVAG